MDCSGGSQRPVERTLQKINEPLAAADVAPLRPRTEFAHLASREAPHSGDMCLFIKHCDRADGASGATFYLERKSDELEPAFADQLLHVHKAFDVRESHVTTDVMHLEIVAARAAWADSLDPKHLNFLATKPGRRFSGKAGEIGEISVPSIATAMEIHVQKYHVVRLDRHASRRLGRFEILDQDVGLERLVR
jgi:hypothetical protein